MPSGTSLSSESTSSCEYRSLEYERASPRDCIAPSEPIPRYVLYCLPLTKISSPGDSATPASSEPSITVSAPTAMALAMSPDCCRPPSPMTGTPAGRHALAASQMAVTCGTPMPVTTRVVQIDPGPTPTLTASTPASTSACAPALVATLPPTMSTREPTSCLSRATISTTRIECPCAVSTMITSMPASTRAIARLYDSSPTPTAASQSSR